jgi:hypothetical protein
LLGQVLTHLGGVEVLGRCLSNLLHGLGLLEEGHNRVILLSSGLGAV